MRERVRETLLLQDWRHESSSHSVAPPLGPEPVVLDLADVEADVAGTDEVHRTGVGVLPLGLKGPVVAHQPPLDGALFRRLLSGF